MALVARYSEPTASAEPPITPSGGSTMGQAPLTGAAWAAPTAAQWLWLGINAIAIVGIAIAIALVVTLLLPPFDEQALDLRRRSHPLAPYLPSVPPLPRFDPPPLEPLSSTLPPPVDAPLFATPAAPLPPDAAFQTAPLTRHLLFVRWLVEHQRLSG